ncbi:tyrosine-type recombinase/integrase [Celeribacter ethanolicus]|uniref:tyrosine-type recombinase/integrase n=1 Tax=Celeribacter ethanolicus TaxID=1758178 RepID=UPI000836DF0B|nr:tyrosine-type recombinase/integrase [Celeribacter ethanolicus]TNE64442.1 MAG: hypothetical protein EP336_15245 [Paracoccaceae bacterium]
MRKPAKPRIAKPHLSWKWNKSKGTWEPYHRVTWSQDGKRKERHILLRWGGDAEELDRQYWACEAGRHERQAAPLKYTWKALIIAWRKDPRVQNKLSAGTKTFYRPTMDNIMEKNGNKDVRNTTRSAIRAAHDKLAATPREADKYIQTIRMLWNYGKNKQDWPIGDNPASKIDLYGKQRELEAWPEWMIKKLPGAPESVRIAAELILGTGQRPGAAITMKWEQFEGEWMHVTDEKADELFPVYCPEELRSFLAAQPKRGQYVLAKNLTEPLTYNAVASSFQKWRKTLGDDAKKFSLHGLRKLAIVRLAEAGCSDAEIQAVTNQSAEMVVFYRKKANRKALSKRAMTRNRTKIE